MDKLILNMVLLLITWTGCTIIRNNDEKSLTINIQPLDNIDSIQVSKTIKNLSDYLDKCGLQNYNIKILKSKESPQKCEIGYYKYDMPYFRLRADSLINYYNTKNKNEFTILVTNRDISCTVHNIQDYGVLGLSNFNKNVCVVSTFRIKNRNDIWKVMAHEFTHGYFKLRHCEKDNKCCIIQDAHRKPNFKNKEFVCDSCYNKIQKFIKNY